MKPSSRILISEQLGPYCTYNVMLIPITDEYILPPNVITRDSKDGIHNMDMVSL